MTSEFHVYWSLLSFTCHFLLYCFMLRCLCRGSTKATANALHRPPHRQETADLDEATNQWTKQGGFLTRLCIYWPGGVYKTSTSQLAHSCKHVLCSCRRQQSVLALDAYLELHQIMQFSLSPIFSLPQGDLSNRILSNKQDLSWSTNTDEIWWDQSFLLHRRAGCQSCPGRSICSCRHIGSKGTLLRHFQVVFQFYIFLLWTRVTLSNLPDYHTPLTLRASI